MPNREPPHGYAYAARYCEENVWHLAGREDLPAGRRTVLFITNAIQRCPVWAQRGSASPDYPVVWDYHVVLVVHTGRGPQVWDLDSCVALGSALATYLDASFPMSDHLADILQPVFRLVDADAYRAEFASDRSHMRSDDGFWAATPPPWPAIGHGSNLHRYWHPTAATPGRLCRNRRELVHELTRQCPSA